MLTTPAARRACPASVASVFGIVPPELDAHHYQYHLTRANTALPGHRTTLPGVSYSSSRAGQGVARVRATGIRSLSQMRSSGAWFPAGALCPCHAEQLMKYPLNGVHL